MEWTDWIYSTILIVEIKAQYYSMLMNKLFIILVLAKPSKPICKQLAKQQIKCWFINLEYFYWMK